MVNKWLIAMAVGVLSMFVTTAGGLLIHFSSFDDAPAGEDSSTKRSSGTLGIGDAGAKEEIINAVPDGRRGWGRGEARAPEYEGPRFFQPSEGGGRGGGKYPTFLNVRMIPIPYGGG